MVISRPTIVIGMPELYIIRAASGSVKTLNSAALVILPLPSEPPIATIRSIWSLTSGYSLNSKAMLVNEPVGTNVIFSSLSMMVLRNASTALIFKGFGRSSGKS